MTWLAALHRAEGGPSLRLLSSQAQATPRTVDANGCAVLFGGTLAPDVRVGDGSLRDEEFVHASYLRLGTALFPRLRGRFALAVLDRRRDVFYALGDPMGAHPLFYAAEGETIHFSPSAEILARRDDSRPELNRLTAAAFLARLPLEGDDTFFLGVHRLLPGHLLEVRDGRMKRERYWLPQGGEAGYSVDRFHDLLRAAVERLVVGRAGVFLSGGLDSALVAGVLVEVSRERGLPTPVALSVALRGLEADEEPTQREVASRLGMEHVIASPEELLETGEGLLQKTLEIARSPVPRPPELVTPTYDSLGRIGVARGCTTILGGDGGDEWLLPPTGYASDSIFSLNVVALARLCRAWVGYWPGGQPLSVARGVIWHSGLRAAARALAASATNALRPSLIARIRISNAEERLPPWIVPDPELRRNLLARFVDETAPEPPGGAAAVQKRALLDATSSAIAQEWAFATEARIGASGGCPLVDPDVVDFLYRMPPRQLISEGRAKAPAKDVLSLYLGDFANTWPRTVYGNSVWRETIRREGHSALSASEGTSMLAELELVDSAGIHATLSVNPDHASRSELTAAWRSLSLTSWLWGIQNRGSALQFPHDVN